VSGCGVSLGGWSRAAKDNEGNAFARRPSVVDQVSCRGLKIRNIGRQLLTANESDNSGGGYCEGSQDDRYWRQEIEGLLNECAQQLPVNKTACAMCDST
jgi:hypothetical protein